MHPLDHLPEKLAGAELKDFVGDIDLVDEIVISVEPGSSGLVGRVLDDDRGRREIYERPAGIYQPCNARKHKQGYHEPPPLGKQIHEEVNHINPVVLF